MSAPAQPHVPRCLLLDWGDTLMRDFPEFSGPMATWPRVEAVPDVKEVLVGLRGHWVLALATNAEASDEPDIRAALCRVGLDDIIARIYCFRRIGHKKPSAQFFDYVLDGLQIDRSRVVMVGDSFEADVLGANRCGIRAVWFNERSREDRTGSMFRTIHRFGALPHVLERFDIT